MTDQPGNQSEKTGQQSRQLFAGAGLAADLPPAGQWDTSV